MGIVAHDILLYRDIIKGLTFETYQNILQIFH